MQNVHWSPSEKKIARAVFDQALANELAEVLAEFKRRAANATTADAMWSVRHYLDKAEREIEQKYDFRYSQLLIVFGRLLYEGRTTIEQLGGLSEEKLDYIRLVASR